eukprot:3085463-Prymnesium_polylepis.1
MNHAGRRSCARRTIGARQPVHAAWMGAAAERSPAAAARSAQQEEEADRAKRTWCCSSRWSRSCELWRYRGD